VNVVYSRAECAYILEHSFASKSFSTVSNAISNACPNKAVLNKTTIRRLVTELRDKGVFVTNEYRATKTVEIKAAEISNRASTATTGHSSKIYLHLLCSFVHVESVYKSLGSRLKWNSLYFQLKICFH
jgi:hypothetical protein